LHKKFKAQHHFNYVNVPIEALGLYYSMGPISCASNRAWAGLLLELWSRASIWKFVVF